MQEAYNVKENVVPIRGGDSKIKGISCGANPVGDDGDNGDGDSGVLFPTEVFPKTVHRFINETSEAMECPPELVGLPLLVTLASAIGNSRVIRLKAGWEESATLYAASVASPGDKKTPAANEAFKPAHAKQAEFRKSYELERRSYDAAEDKDVLLEPVMERTYVDDVTVEALVVTLRDNTRGVLVSKDELSSWIRGMDQYKQGKGSDRQFWLSVWSSKAVSVDRKTQQQPIILDKPFVCLYGSIQPGILSELGGNRDDGLLDRFLFAYPEPVPSRWSDAEITPEAQKAVTDLYNSLRALQLDVDVNDTPVPKALYFDADAKSLFIQHFNAHNAEMDTIGFPDRLRGPWKKLEAYLARLTLILSLLRSQSENKPERVEMVDVDGANVLLDYFKAQTRKVYGELHAPGRLDLLAVDVARFVEIMGGSFEDTPENIYSVLRSDHLPGRVNELTKDLKAIQKRTPSLKVEQGSKGRDKEKRRTIKITLENVVPAVPVVPGTALTYEQVNEAWNDTASRLRVKRRYLDGELCREDAVEVISRLVVYHWNLPGHEWQQNAAVVDEELDKRTLMELSYTPPF